MSSHEVDLAQYGFGKATPEPSQPPIVDLDQYGFGRKVIPKSSKPSEDFASAIMDPVPGALISVWNYLTKGATGPVDPLVPATARVLKEGGEYVKRMGEHVGGAVTGLATLPGMVGVEATRPLLPSEPWREEHGKTVKELGSKAGEWLYNLMAGTPEQQREATLALLGPEWAEAAKTQSAAPLLSKPGKSLADLVFFTSTTGLPLAGGTAVALAKAAPLLTKIPKVGPPAARGLDTAARTILPRWGWTDKAVANEAQREGRIMLKTVEEVGPLGKEAGELVSKWGTGMMDQFIMPEVTGKKMSIADWRALSPLDQSKVLKIRRSVDQNHDELYRLGLISKETHEAGVGSYLHQMYELYNRPRSWRKELESPVMAPIVQDAKLWLAQNLKSTRVPGLNVLPAEVESAYQQILDHVDKARLTPDVLLRSKSFGSEIAALLHRQDIPDPIRKILGPISGGEVSVATTLDFQNRLIFNHMALRNLTQITARDGLPYVIPHVPSGAPPYPRYRQLTDSPALGPLKEAWVHPDIYDAVQSLHGESWAGPLQEYMRAFKVAKVVWNVPSHINNILGDMIFTTLAGKSFVNPANRRHAKEAASDMWQFYKDPNSVTRLPILREAIGVGYVVPGFASAELAHVYAHLARDEASNALSAFFRSFYQNPVAEKIARFYDLQDQYFRYFVYRAKRADGMSPQQIVEESSWAWPNYEVSSKFGEWARGQRPLTVGTSMSVPSAVGPMVTSPFTSFPLEAMRIYATAAERHPVRLMAALSMPVMAQSAILGAQGLTMGDYHRFLEGLPEEKRGRLWLGPFGAKKRWVDFTSAVPLAEYWKPSKGASDVAGRTMPNLGAHSFFFSSPAWSGLEVLTNRSLQTGRPIFNPAAGRPWSDYVSYMVDRFVPFPSSGQQAIEATKRAIQGLPGRRFQEGQDPMEESLSRSMSPAKWTPEEELLTEGRVTRRGKMSEATRTTRSKLSDPRLSPEEKESIRQGYKSLMNDLREKRR